MWLWAPSLGLVLVLLLLGSLLSFAHRTGPRP